MESEKISVIIPVYKVEKYLAKCVDSVLAQTYGDLEILLVDDGSPDGCGAICDGYASRDSRVRVIHKPNGGLSSARNAGLDAASGAYVGFVDSDDYIDPAMYEKLHAALVSTGADVCVCDVVYVDEQGALKGPPIPPMAEEVLSPEQAWRRVELADDGWRYVTAWNRLYRRAVFDGLRFQEGKIHEDELSVVPIYEKCGRAAVISDVLYWDVGRPGSIMTASAALRRLDAMTAFQERRAFYLSRGWKDLAALVLRRAYGHLWVVMDGADVAAGREKILPWVRWVSAQMARELDLRAARIWLRYFARRFGGGARA